MNAQTNLPATRGDTQLTPLDGLKRQFAGRADEFKSMLPAHISIDKFQRTVVTAALTNPKLLECDRQSLLIASSKAAVDGLLPDGRESALVPFTTRVRDGNQWSSKWLVQYMPMVYGLRKKILQSGEVLSLQVGVVYRAEIDSGAFFYEVGVEPPIRHRPKLDMTEEDVSDDNLVVAYSIALLKNGDHDPVWSVEIMRRFEIEKVQEMSQTGATRDRKGQPRTPTGPWADWKPEQWKKTVLRRHSKVLPMSGDLLESILREDEEHAASGAAQILNSVKGSDPVRLPSPDEAEDEQGHDPETGEVQTDTRGMTETDEETARALDTGHSVDDLQDETDEDEGQGEEAQDDDEPLDPYKGKPFAERRREIIDLLNAADDIDAVKFAENTMTRFYVQFPDKVKQELEDKVAEAKDRVA